MASRARLAAGRAARDAARDAARRAVRRTALKPYVAARRVRARPVLSVVIPVYNVEKYLRECLDSVLTQSLADLEVIAVDDGSTDGCLQVLREYAARDYRVRVLTQTNSGQGVARNLGVAHARGEFLTFCDSDDTVPPGAYEHMVETLRRSGSDFCVGSARRFAHKQFLGSPWARTVHEADRLRTTIDEFPEAMQDIIACNRMFRRSFWVDRVGSFRGHIAYEDHVPMLAAYVRAGRFDVLKAITYNWRVREDQTSTGQQKARLENLLDRIAVKEEAFELLQQEASSRVYDAWVARTLEVDFPAFIVHALKGNSLYRNLLAATYRTFFDRATDDALRAVSYYQKVRGWLVREEQWAEVERAEAFFRRLGRIPPTRAADGRVLAAVDATDEPFLSDLPERLLELAAHETTLTGAVEHADWMEDRLHVDGFAMVRGLDSTVAEPAIEAALRLVGADAVLPLDVRRGSSPRPTLWAKNPSAAYDDSWFGFDVDAADLVRLTRSALPSGAAGHWALDVRVVQQGIERVGRLHQTSPGSSAAWPRARTVLIDNGGAHMLRPLLDSEHGYGVVVEPARVVASRLSPVSAEGRLEGRLVAPEGAALGQLVLTGPGGRTHEAPLAAEGDGWAFSTVLPPVSAAVRSTAARPLWRLGVRTGEGTLPVHAAEPADGWLVADDGAVSVAAERRALRVVSVAVEDDTVRVAVEAEGIDHELREARLGNDGVQFTLLRAEPSVLVFDARLSVLGGPRLLAPSGGYSLSVVTADGVTVPARATDALLARLPMTVGGEDLQLVVTRTVEDVVRFTVQPPLRPDEHGLTRQRQLQREYATAAPAVRETVLFQCYRGEFATDSQRALHDRLGVLRPGITRLWGVKDHATELPEGAVPVVIGSREWYDVLASSRYLCSNVDFDPYFRRRPHQKYLQTFHGYPFKSMGITFWAGKGFGPDRIALEVERRNDEWSAILVPAPFCAEFYRREYSYRGEILALGYPRDDALVTTDAAAVRKAVLDRLGVPQERTVVLYAPTYRDSLTTRVFSAELFDELDLVELTRRLGPDHVVLMRGHNNNKREMARVRRTGQIVDVTDYPEVNDLILAADAAVLDYSSLRFDWAITGKPVVFFVPDLDDYFGTRPPLFDYRESAPGPLVATTAEVAERLADLAQLRREYAAALDSFNEWFNGLNDGGATDRVIEAFFD